MPYQRQAESREHAVSSTARVIKAERVDYVASRVRLSIMTKTNHQNTEITKTVGLRWLPWWAIYMYKEFVDSVSMQHWPYAKPRVNNNYSWRN